MKHTLHILILGFAALCAPGRHATANAAEDKPNPDLEAMKARLDAQDAEIAALRAANEVKAPTEQPSSELAMLAKGAGISLEDVSWRVRGGLSAKQAVDAALAQKDYDADVAAAAKKAKATK